MKPQDQELMRRYIYQVLRRVPKGRRDEARMELEELIGDMYADKGSMEETLTQLGDPAEFARQYQKGSQYLIGPEYLETYLWFVKVVLLCTGIPILAVALVQAMVFTGQDQMSALIGGIVEGLRTGIPDALVSCVTAFGAVTLVFAVMERQKVQLEQRKVERWSLEQLTEQPKGADVRWTPRFLAPVPDKKARISRGDSIVGIVFLVILCVLLVFAPQFFAAVITEGERVQTVPVFNLERWGSILPVFVLSLLVGLVASFLILIIGSVYGSVAGFLGGKVDLFMMRIVDIIYTVPDLLIIILLASTLKYPLQSLAEKPGFGWINIIGVPLISILIVFALLYWVGMARIVRSQVLTLKESEYVTAARALGAGTGRIIKKHILTNCIGTLIVTTTLQIPSAIFTESFLSFLGIGVSAPMPSLGSLASTAIDGLQSYPYRLFAPAIAISVVILSFNLFGDGLRDAFDPKLKN